MALTKVQILLLRACKAKDPIKRLYLTYRRFYSADTVENSNFFYWNIVKLLEDAQKEAGLVPSARELVQAICFMHPGLKTDTLLQDCVWAYIHKVRFYNRKYLPKEVYPKLHAPFV